jgi:predicted membrane-bound spermidine synthase
MRFSFIKSDASKLFLISFLILYFELVCIRWLSSYVLYLGYFTNFVLLGSLLGIGAGALLAHKQYKLIQWLPAVLFVFLVGALLAGSQVNPDFADIIYFTNNIAIIQLPPYILLPIIFIGVALIFTLLAQDLGVLLTKFAPLRAYSLNILGSLAGIASFMVISFLWLPSWVWFLVFAVFIIPFLPLGRSFGINVILLLGLIGAVATSDYTLANIWSPYYRLNLFQITVENPQFADLQPIGARRTDKLSAQYLLLANGVGHQEMFTSENTRTFYYLPYTAFDGQPAYKNVLVVGAGGGNDVAVALERGVQHVDAVEIDPRIIDLGKNYHPEQPYNDPRVTVYIDDARSFLEKTDTKYDAIIFALPDSLVLTTTSGSIRLESYLFTTESFQSVKEHLKPDGVFVLYNYYRNEWLIDKIVSMLGEVFDAPPVAYRYSDPQLKFFATVFAGPKSRELDLTEEGFTQPSTHFIPATDNWPFLYMKEPSLPRLYGSILALILLFSFLYVWRLSPKGAINRYGLPFFFMGCAFTLLETKSIVNFLLLFGSTWLVNSLVFFAILSVVLIANWLAARYRFSQLKILYALLIATLAFNFVVPLETLLFDNLVARYILATAFLFSPIFVANLIYSTVFRDTEKANVAFGANLLGTMVGGTTEYLALYLGYQNLIVFAGIFYFLAFYFIARHRTALHQLQLEV